MATLGLLLMAPPAFAEEPEGFGNNLKMPVIWAEDQVVGDDVVLRGDGSQQADLPNAVKGDYEVFGDDKDAVLDLDPDNATYVVEDGAALFLQQIEGNTWQAENRTLTDTGLRDSVTGKLSVSYVDWGDNLEVKDWRTQPLRVEARLLQNVSSLPDDDVAGPDGAGLGMTGYLMDKLDDTPKGPAEMWGVVAAQSGSDWLATEEQLPEAFVYTDHACLTIERIDNAGTMKWDSVAMTWTGTPVPGFPVCLGEGEGGFDQFGAEVTISGGMTYGSVWNAKDAAVGLYRMTFSLQPLSGVDITESTELYASVEEADASTSSALAEAGPGGGGSGGSGGEPEGNDAVILPELDLTYIDVSLDFKQGQPTRPVNLTAAATGEVGEVALSWDPPVYEGTSEITGYIVTAQGFGGVKVLAGTERVTLTGLPGGVARTFTVVAVNDLGPGDEASVVATPLASATPPSAPPTTPPTTPPTVTPPTDQGQAVTVQVRAVSGGKKLYVNVGPNKGKGYYQFTVQKLSGGTWRTLPKVYKTYGNGETRRLRLSKGTYRVIVLPRYGLQGMTSEVIGLRTTVPSVLPVETDQAVSLIARSKSDERKLYVNLDPNMGKGYFQFVVQKQSGGQWKALSKVYKTKTRAEKRTLNLRRGTYRVIVMPRYGYQGSMSDSIWLRR